MLLKSIWKSATSLCMDCKLKFELNKRELSTHGKKENCLKH